MKSFHKVVTSIKQLTIFSESFILDVWEGSEYAFGLEFYIIIIQKQSTSTRCKASKSIDKGSTLSIFCDG